MRYELKHDKLAAQIFLRASAAAKARRRAAEVYVLYAEKKRLLTVEELEDLLPFLAVLTPPQDLQDLMDRSREHLHAKAAEEKEQLEAELKEKQRLLEQAKRQRKRATAFSLVSIFFTVIASIASLFALNQANKAEKALVVVVRGILQEADRYILELDYYNAWNKLREAAALNAAKKKVGTAMLELVFWHAETGDFQSAKGMLDTACQYLDNALTTDSLGAETTDLLSRKKLFRRAIQQLQPEKFVALMERYYPVESNLVKVGEGNLNRGDYLVSLNSFYLAKTEVTYWQWGLFCSATSVDSVEMNKPGWGSEGDNPAVLVNWYAATEYCNWVGTQLGFAQVYTIKGENVSTNWNAKGFRLPTESEWEYAARGGPKRQDFIYSGSNEIAEVAWYVDDDSAARTKPVATRKANTLGIFDMSGNVWEWCWDWKDDYDPSAKINPHGPDFGAVRVLRGGCWYYVTECCRVAHRGNDYPGNADDYTGFRLARTF